MPDALHVVCPHCEATNRVPGARLVEAPSCGQCHRPLFTAQPVELAQAAFERHVGRNDIPVLVDFWAPWCGPCKVMAPHFVQAAGLLEPRVRLVKVNTDVEQGLAARHGIQSIPTLALFQGGREIARQAGAMGTQDIVDWVRGRLP
ncbi:thioredoxin TrxC [Anaeromyxobacter sp. Fw109-5]|uniref:thioredoxin TrxC n=1 Tax=Anaeromyxobacter sp. (strain Fw109-5) TaxID=404589 RepID=UPI0000ED7CDA|nr:thioredoxin TrxC [Anaeromyxobacter sp. Fw109-5]ABS25786.1 thioredoxin [Anaeromyxobacter sp. Fw109-5]